jgi:hypothetical protein
LFVQLDGFHEEDRRVLGAASWESHETLWVFTDFPCLAESLPGTAFSSVAAGVIDCSKLRTSPVYWSRAFLRAVRSLESPRDWTIAMMAMTAMTKTSAAITRPAAVRYQGWGARLAYAARGAGVGRRRP